MQQFTEAMGGTWFGQHMDPETAAEGVVVSAALGVGWALWCAFSMPPLL